jgi:hypothetical protein
MNIGTKYLQSEMRGTQGERRIDMLPRIGSARRICAVTHNRDRITRPKGR